MTLSRLLLFYILFFICFQLNAGESIQSFINKVENLNKTEFKLFKENYLSSNSSTKEKDEIINIIDKQFENDLMGRFILLVKTADEKNQYSDFTKAWANYHLSCFLATKQLYAEALKRNELSLKLSTKLNDKDFKYLALLNSAGIYFVQKKYAKAFHYYSKCIYFNNKISKASNYNNLALCKKRLKNYYSSLYFFKKGLTILKRPKNKQEEEIYYLIKGNIGSLYSETNKLDSAKSYLYSEYSYYKKNNINSNNTIYSVGDIIVLKSRLNENYSNEIQEIIQRIKQIKDLETKFKIISDLENSLFNFISKKELQYIKNYFFNVEKKYFKLYSVQQLTITKILLSDKINSLRESNLLEHKKNQLEKKNSQYKTVLLIIAFGILVFLMFFILNIQKQRKIQIKNEMLITQQKEEIFKTKQQLLQNEVNHQQMQLQALSVNLKIKTETEELFLQKIKELKKKRTTDIDSIVNEIQIGIQNLKEIDRKLFLTKSEQAYSNQLFINRLKENHPNLSNNEITFCQFCCFNLSSKEISQITGQSEGAVRVYKNKIKIKIGLNKEQNLSEYLNRFNSSQTNAL